MDATAFKGLSATQLSQIKPSSISGLTASEIENIPSSSCVGWASNQIENLTPSACYGFSSYCMKNINPASYFGFSDQCIYSTSEAWSEVSVTQISYVKPESFAGFDCDNFGDLERSTVASLNLGQLSFLTSGWYM